ncbi:MAG: ArsA family ATPase [Planctomycetes bacterium]|nr:ArsA family ATPase [Planctomycetota bacterium]
MGKTTCSAATALSASRAGRRVLLVSTDPAHSLADVFSCEPGAGERDVAPRLRVLEIDAETETHRYLEQARSQLASVFGAAVLKEAVRQIELTATMPGVADVAMFDRMAEILLSRDRGADLVVFDTAPTGHTLRLLAMPESMAVWVRALAERRRAATRAGETAATAGAGQASAPDLVLAALERRAARLEAVLGRLTSDETAVVLVLVPERLPIEETARAVRMLAGSRIRVGGLIVNRILPDCVEGEYSRARKSQERLYLDEIAVRFPGVPRTDVPQLALDVRGPADLDEIALRLWG